MKQLEDTDIMPFGKHKGQPMADVPVKYLHWLWHESNREAKTPVGDYIKRNIDVLKTEDKDLLW